MSGRERKPKPRQKRDAPKSKSSAAFRLEPNPVDGFHDEEFLSGNYEPHRLFPHPHPGTLARHTNGQTIHPVKLSADDIWELLFSDGTNDVDTDEAQEWAERAVKAGVARVDSGEMYADSWVLLDWFSNGAPMDGFSITRSGYQEHGNAAGSPIRFRVIAVYSNGAERELAAVDTIPADAHSDPGVVFQTDDEEFAVFVARRPRETDPATEVVFDRPADHKPDGAPF